VALVEKQKAVRTRAEHDSGETVGKGGVGDGEV